MHQYYSVILNVMDDIFTKIDIGLLTKYLCKETNERETNRIKEWLTSSPENSLKLKKYQNAWSLATSAAGIQEWDIKKSKEQFLLKLIQYQSDIEKNRPSFLENSWKIVKNVLSYAAVILLLLSLPSLLIYRHYFMDRDDAAGKVFTEISAPKGSRTQMVLADGSKVWLNAGSVLKYGVNFNKSNREVFLDGEAYFDVVKNKEKPFIVKTSKLTLQVLGTSFNVKSYNEENTIETTLIKGAVKIEKLELDGRISNYLLKPNQKVIFNKKDDDIKFYDLSDKKSDKKVTQRTPLPDQPESPQNTTEQISALVEKDISWKDGYFLVFDETLENIMTKVERRFDINIEFKNEAIKKLRYTGKIKESTPEQILEAMEITSPIDYKIKGKQVEIWENLNRKEKFMKK